MEDPQSTTRAPARPMTHRRRLLWALCLFALLFVGVRAVRAAYLGNDFGAYHAAARALLAGERIFDAYDSIDGQAYIYPPTLAALVIPLTVFSERVGGIV